MADFQKRSFGGKEMKVKIFTGVNTEVLEHEINKWLEELPMVQMKILPIQSESNDFLTITIFYSEGK